MSPPGRVLSIQSHVARGYVGNKAAVFPMQLLGHHVDSVNTVQFTSMYVHEGPKSTPEDLELILQTLPLAQRMPGPGDHPGPLQDHSLIMTAGPVDHKYLLTGYVGNANLIGKIVEFVRHQKSLNSSLLWLCDPVIGDNGKPYVSPEVIDVYRTSVLPLADIVTPNQFELEWLCGTPVSSISVAMKCCEELHALGPSIVIVTSIGFDKDTELNLLASEKTESGIRQFLIPFPKFDVYLGGTGDLMAAMILDGLDRFDNRIDLACERAVAILHGVIKFTLNSSCASVDVIGGMAEIQSPSMKFQSKQVHKPSEI